MKKVDIEEFVYGGRGTISPEYEEKFEKIENALGFRLFFWQKYYIRYGVMRRTGLTTAQIIRDLLVNGVSEDYLRKQAYTKREEQYRRQLIEIAKKFETAGIEIKIIKKRGL